jgi:hypothetical protein
MSSEPNNDTRIQNNTNLTAPSPGTNGHNGRNGAPLEKDFTNGMMNFLTSLVIADE